MKQQPPAHAAAAEYLERLHRDTYRGPGELAQELCAPGGKLAGFCTTADLLLWHRLWKKKEKQAENFQVGPEISVDPATLETVEDGGQMPEGEEERSEVRSQRSEGGETRTEAEIAGGILHFMDARLLRAGLRWRETCARLRDGEAVESRTGSGRVVEASGRVVEWVSGAVLIGVPGAAPRKVVAEAKFYCFREGSTARILKIELTRGGADDRATAQAVGSLLLLLRGEAGGLKNQVEVAAATGCTKANVSAKMRRMAGAVVKAGNKASFRGLRCKETLGKGGGQRSDVRCQRSEVGGRQMGGTSNTEHPTSNE